MRYPGDSSRLHNVGSVPDGSGDASPRIARSAFEARRRALEKEGRYADARGWGVRPFKTRARSRLRPRPRGRRLSYCRSKWYGGRK